MTNQNKIGVFLSSVGLMTALIAPQAVFAHAHLTEANPKQKAVLHNAPKEVSLTFSEDLETSMAQISVKNLKSGEVVSQGKPTDGGGGPKVIKIELTPLKAEKATYEVSWKVVSTDTHRMQGKYEFTYEPKTK